MSNITKFLSFANGEVDGKNQLISLGELYGSQNAMPVYLPITSNTEKAMNSKLDLKRSIT